MRPYETLEFRQKADVQFAICKGSKPILREDIASMLSWSGRTQPSRWSELHRDRSLDLTVHGEMADRLGVALMEQAPSKEGSPKPLSDSRWRPHNGLGAF